MIFGFLGDLILHVLLQLSPVFRVQTLTYRTGRLLLLTGPLEPLRLFTLEQPSERQGGKLWFWKLSHKNNSMDDIIE